MKINNPLKFFCSSRNKPLLSAGFYFDSGNRTQYKIWWNLMPPQKRIWFEFFFFLYRQNTKREGCSSSRRNPERMEAADER